MGCLPKSPRPHVPSPTPPGYRRRARASLAVQEGRCPGPGGRLLRPAARTWGLSSVSSLAPASPRRKNGGWRGRDLRRPSTTQGQGKSLPGHRARGSGPASLPTPGPLRRRVRAPRASQAPADAHTSSGAGRRRTPQLCLAELGLGSTPPGGLERVHGLPGRRAAASAAAKNSVRKTFRRGRSGAPDSRSSSRAQAPRRRPMGRGEGR